jgi:hypothetical protein
MAQTGVTVRRVVGGAARAAGGAALVVLAAAAAASMAFARTPPRTVTDQGPGTCHHAEDPNELVVIPSDASPAVPCDIPHQTETMWTTTVTGPVAASPDRPNGELLNVTFGSACSDYLRIRRYLGAGPNDVTWGINTWSRFPTAADWAKGDRTLACQGSTTTDSPSGPTIDYPISEVMLTSRSARFRKCRSPAGPVTCDRPHIAEAVGPNAVLTGPWPGAAQEATSAVESCGPVVTAYLGEPVGARPDLAITPDPVAQGVWNPAGQPIDCWIRFADGRTVTGSLRGGLR